MSNKEATASQEGQQDGLDPATWQPPRPDFSKPPAPGNDVMDRDDVKTLERPTTSKSAAWSLDVERADNMRSRGRIAVLSLGPLRFTVNTADEGAASFFVVLPRWEIGWAWAGFHPDERAFQ